MRRGRKIKDFDRQACADDNAIHSTFLEVSTLPVVYFSSSVKTDECVQSLAAYLSYRSYRRTSHRPYAIVLYDQSTCQYVGCWLAQQCHCGLCLSIFYIFVGQGGGGNGFIILNSECLAEPKWSTSRSLQFKLKSIRCSQNHKCSRKCQPEEYLWDPAGKSAFQIMWVKFDQQEILTCQPLAWFYY